MKNLTTVARLLFIAECSRWRATLEWPQCKIFRNRRVLSCNKILEAFPFLSLSLSCLFLGINLKVAHSPARWCRTPTIPWGRPFPRRRTPWYFVSFSFPDNASVVGQRNMALAHEGRRKLKHRHDVAARFFQRSLTISQARWYLKAKIVS